MGSNRISSIMFSTNLEHAKTCTMLQREREFRGANATKRTSPSLLHKVLSPGRNGGTIMKNQFSRRQFLATAGAAASVTLLSEPLFDGAGRGAPGAP